MMTPGATEGRDSHGGPVLHENDHWRRTTRNQELHGDDRKCSSYRMRGRWAAISDPEMRLDPKTAAKLASVELASQETCAN